MTSYFYDKRVSEPGPVIEPINPAGALDIAEQCAWIKRQIMASCLGVPAHVLGERP